MKKNDFYSEIKEALEMEDSIVNENTLIHLSSMQTLSLIAFADEKFEKQIRIIDLKDAKSISDLMHLIGDEKFSD